MFTLQSTGCPSSARAPRRARRCVLGTELLLDQLVDLAAVGAAFGLLITAPTIAPIALPLPALICSAASGLASIAAATIDSSSLSSAAIWARPSRSTIACGLTALGDQCRQHGLAAAVGDLLLPDQANSAASALGVDLGVRSAVVSAWRRAAASSPVTQLATVPASPARRGVDALEILGGLGVGREHRRHVLARPSSPT